MPELPEVVDVPVALDQAGERVLPPERREEEQRERAEVNDEHPPHRRPEHETEPHPAVAVEEGRDAMSRPGLPRRRERLLDLRRCDGHGFTIRGPVASGSSRWSSPRRCCRGCPRTPRPASAIARVATGRWRRRSG